METTIRRLANDFENEEGPFSRDLFPEETLIDELGDEHKTEYLSMLCTLDYNRRVDTLVSNILELDSLDADFFTPESVSKMGESFMHSVFEAIGFRYPSRDSKAWRRNSIIVVNEFGGSWDNVIADSNYDAPALVETLRNNNFMCIKGDKLAPFYARVINDYVHELDNLWRLPVPVDTHIRRLSQDLFNNPDLSDDGIRQVWRDIGREMDISPHLVDGALWQVGYSWNDWGEDYWNEVTA